jgi:predicted RNase H-like HicB family nuclease
MMLTCYAEARGAEWTAQCPELDIAVQGSSFDEVRDRLKGAIEMYMERVGELPQEEQERFLRRRVPVGTLVWMSVKLLASNILTNIGRRRNGNAPHTYNFPINCHV